MPTVSREITGTMSVRFSYAAIANLLDLNIYDDRCFS